MILSSVKNGRGVFNACVGLCGVFIILFALAIIVLYLRQQTCLLCLLESISLIGIGHSLLMTMRYGHRTEHWVLAILLACVGASVSIRQICFYIVTPDSWGPIISGFHVYTWCYFVYFVVIVASALILMVHPKRH
jgi:hypothetical protein